MNSLGRALYALLNSSVTSCSTHRRKQRTVQQPSSLTVLTAAPCSHQSLQAQHQQCQLGHTHPCTPTAAHAQMQMLADSSVISCAAAS
eukprot:3019-Heterococcus_DN1.PRE.3